MMQLLKDSLHIYLFSVSLDMQVDRYNTTTGSNFGRWKPNNPIFPFDKIPDTKGYPRAGMPDNRPGMLILHQKNGSDREHVSQSRYLSIFWSN